MTTEPPDSTSQPQYIEGEAPFEISATNKPCKTWYRIYGSLSQSSTTRPLIIVHGGPGLGHNYMISIGEDLWANHGITCVLYDQVGCGNSTHLPEKKGDTTFFTVQLFLDELENLLSHLDIKEYDFLGNSWGGMLGSEHAIRQPLGLRKLVLSDSPTSMPIFNEDGQRMRKELPKETLEVLEKNEMEGTTDSEEYRVAMSVYLARHLCRAQPFPKDLQDTFKNMSDPTVYHTM